MDLRFIRVLFLITAIERASSKDEKSLHVLLLKGYDPYIRPVRNFSDALPVSFDFVLEEVNDLDVKEQTLDISAFVTLIWNDPSLTWDKSTYGGIDETVLDSKLVWTPDLSLHNRANLDENPFEYAKNTRVSVRDNGNVTWVIYTSWKSSCSTDVTWWPVDRQRCVMKFGSLTYDKRRLSLTRSRGLAHISHGAAKRKMMTKLFDVDSGQWATLNLTSYEMHSKRPCGKVRQCDFATVAVALGLQRLPLYYLLYIILPLCALILSFLLIFHLDIGQRASYGVGILLSISVYLMTISEYLPLKSDTTPFLGSVFVLHFFLLCLAVPVAEFTAHLAQKSERPPPAWCMKLLKWSPAKRLFHTMMIKMGRQKCCHDPEESTKCATNLSPIGDSTEDVVKDATYGEDEGNFASEWRKVGRYFDVLFSLLFLFIIVFVPLIIAGSLRTDFPPPPPLPHNLPRHSRHF